MRVNALLRLYPSSWRALYGEEMAALLEQRRVDRRDRLDLLRGALDAWLHPSVPSLAPPMAALAGGGVWTVVATAVLVQPVAPDWPGYLLEIVPLACFGAICLFVSVAGCLLRAGEPWRRTEALAAALVAIGYTAWIAALGATAAGVMSGAALAAAQAVAMVGTVVVGLNLIRRRDEPIGLLLIATSVSMLVPSTGGWLVFGLGWTAIGMALLVTRAWRMETPDGAGRPERA
jgi:hypothetical protein